ncbi:hypothetical protein [Pseudoxanthomonas suwonensis]|uniref:Uncharacterized protein n=1 Tax=Pseudoxanthomonas suwonensis TaxID=314722 RepID=A0A0E3Z0C9_9GAMM|nr:hypothetical protein [Pseudoxanthomonas suwonensis]AKC86448.1 hypothetical protein WQ53_06385 [Pseudoxanthomonas suwonensis]
MATSRWLPAGFTLAVGLLSWTTAAAQAGVELHHGAVAEADFGDATLSARVDGLRLRAPEFGLLQGRATLGADYAYTHYDYTGLPTRNRDLHRLALPLQWRRDGAYLVRLVVAPTIASSSNVFKDLPSRGSSDDLALYGGATVERATPGGWGWRAGAGYDDRFGDPRAYPVLALLHRGARTDLVLGWPRSEAGWQPHPQWRLRLEVAPAGQRWHVVSDERGGAEFFYVSEAWRGTLGADWHPSRHWRLRLEAGYAFDRRHDLVDDTGARIERRVASATTYALALRYGF